MIDDGLKERVSRKIFDRGKRILTAGMEDEDEFTMMRYKSSIISGLNMFPSILQFVFDPDLGKEIFSSRLIESIDGDEDDLDWREVQAELLAYLQDNDYEEFYLMLDDVL